MLMKRTDYGKFNSHALYDMDFRRIMMTDIYETKYYFTLSNIPEIDERGEFVLIVEGNNSQLNFEDMTIPEHVLFYINLGLSKNDAIKKVAKERELNKNEVYQQVLDLNSNRE